MNSDIHDSLIRKLNEYIKIKTPGSNKGTNGKLSVVAGSSFYRGASSLAVSAAVRCGVGIVRLASIEKVISACSAICPECTFLPLEENSKGSVSAASFEKNLFEIVSSKAILTGCGMTDCGDTEKIVSSILEKAECPAVIDADGLNSIKKDPTVLRKARCVPIVTPHIGEMSRLTGISCEKIKQERLKTASDFALNTNSVTVLKDYITVVCSPDGRSFVCDRPNAGLAKGGSGDVLAGMIASFAAQGYGQFESAVCGVIIHSLSAELAVEEMTEYAMVPSDIVKFFSKAFAEIFRYKKYIEKKGTDI